MHRILVKATSDPFLFQWMNLGTEGTRASREREIGTLAELSTELVHRGSARIVFLIPAIAVQLRQLSFLPSERKHLLKTIPYTLEEEMVCDADDLHCVMSRPTTNTLWVAAIQKRDLDFWLKQFASVGLKISDCIPEQILLLQQSSSWCMYYESGVFLLRSGGSQIYGVDVQNIALALELATNSFADIPEHIDLFLNERADEEDIMQQIPAQLQPCLTTQVKPLPALFNQRIEIAKELNLLRGTYAQNTNNWLGEIKKWRGTLWLFLIALLIHVGVGYAEYKKSDKELRAIREQIVSMHKSVFPTGNLSNSRKALEGELKRLKGGAASNTSFLGLLEKTSSALQQHQAYQVDSLNYNANNGALELNLVLKDNTEVEAFKRELSSKELLVELLNSVGQNDKVKARLQIKSMP